MLITVWRMSWNNKKHKERLVFEYIFWKWM